MGLGISITIIHYSNCDSTSSQTLNPCSLYAVVCSGKRTIELASIQLKEKLTQYNNLAQN